MRTIDGTGGGRTMVDGAGEGRTERAGAIADFATALRELRRSAGDPSFREMSGRSRAISHTTLHEAAQGNRLPSWSTTVEFVKACGGDPAEYRGRWDAATRRCRAAASAGAATAAPPDTEIEPEHDAVPTPHRRPVLVAVAAVVLVGIAVLGVVLVARPDATATARRADGSRAQDNMAAGPAAQFKSADCPIHQTNPPPAPPAHPGDHGRLVTDVTVPDCSHRPRGSTFVKVWRLRNLGVVTWRGYVLHRMDQPVRRDNCQTVTDVPIPTTPPGGFVDVRAEVVAPDSPTFCVVRFRVFDAAGVDAFPAGRPVNFQVSID